MAKKNSKKAGLSGGEKVGIGVALTTAAVAAAGAYFLYGSSNAKSNRKTVKGWALKAKGEVLEVMEKAGNMTAEEYQAALEKVAAGYSKLQSASKPEIAAFKKEMLSYWKQIAKGTGGAKKAAKKSAKKAVKKVAKKATK
jgi:hypothetical protein